MFLPRLIAVAVACCLAACDKVQEAPPVAPPHAPPPISGGTLAVDAQGALAVAADPDRGAIYVVDLKQRKVRHTVEADDEPGRVALSADHAYVALRRSDGVLAIDLADGTASRFETCPAPRGLALDGDALYVACAEGTLDTLDAPSGARTRRVFLDTDLRDVVIAGGAVHVTRFRSAELLTLDADGHVVRRVTPTVGNGMAPVVAWRTVPLANGRIAMLHQRASLAMVRLAEPEAYGTPPEGGCGSLVGGQVTVFDAAGESVTRLKIRAPLTVDLAPGESSVGLAVPGSPREDGQPRFSLIEPALIDDCASPFADVPDPVTLAAHQVTAVARDGQGHLYAQSREPAALLDGNGGPPIVLSTASALDEGHELFHTDAGRGMACASCHPEGGDDGHVWLFAGHGLRRTQFLVGGLKGTEPFHWAGDMTDFATLMTEVRERRMGGAPLAPDDGEALLDWLDAQPAPPAPRLDAAAVTRGRAVFEATGCAGCHAGVHLTDNLGHDIGTGRRLQTPALRGLAYRTGFMHDGCASELVDRFDPTCGGATHGAVDALPAASLADLVEYLRSL
ncbi:MAG: cytochrome-c peroxidase [Myxococcales bacterium]|nr:cytochrome-c peroxidase [Myxococcales bacterium]